MRTVVYCLVKYFKYSVEVIAKQFLDAIGLFVPKLDWIVMKPSFKILGKEPGSEVLNYAAFDLFLIKIALF